MYRMSARKGNGLQSLLNPNSSRHYLFWLFMADKEEKEMV